MRFVILAFLAIPAFGECGDPGTLATVKEILRDNYFPAEEQRFDVEDVVIRDRTLWGTYTCGATLTFEATPADVIFRRKIQSGGPKYIDFTFEVARDATDFESEERVIEVHTITVMQLVPADQLGF